MTQPLSPNSRKVLSVPNEEQKLDEKPISDDQLQKIIEMAQKSTAPNFNSKSESSLPEGAVQLSAEQFKAIRAERQKIVDNSDKISSREKELLEGLLGFSSLSKEIKLFKNGIEYTFYLQNLSDEEESDFTKKKLELQKRVDENNSESKVDYIFALRMETLKIALKAISFKTDPETVVKFTVDEMLKYLNLPNLDAFFKTWGNQGIVALFDGYNSILSEVEAELSNSKKIEENLKK